MNGTQTLKGIYEVLSLSRLIKVYQTQFQTLGIFWEILKMAKLFTVNLQELLRML